MWLNGVIYVDLSYKEDRKTAKETTIRLLEQGGSLLIFPEGAWNVTENEVVMKLFKGTVEMAIRSGAEIVPIAIDQRGKEFYVNIGENMKCDGMVGKSNEITDKLRDILCTLQWENWECHRVFARAGITKGYSQTFINEIMAESNTEYTLEEIIETRYKDKEKVSIKDAYAFRNNLIPQKNNLFLFRLLYNNNGS